MDPARVMPEAQDRAWHRRPQISQEPQPPVAQEPVQQLASSIGNAAFGVLAQQGAGILPDGRVHPDVEATIARTRGGGAPLATQAREALAPALGDPLADVRVHTDHTAEDLTYAVSARAFTTGSDVYFARGEYRSGSAEGDRLLAHELSHVVQQRGAPTSGPLMVSQPGDPLETQADAVSDELIG